MDVPPGDPRNEAALTPLAAKLLSLAIEPDRTPYVNLHKRSDWVLDDIATVAGQAGKIRELAAKTGTVVLGGKGPLWGYLAGLRCALDANSKARIFFYDPKQRERLVEIPAELGVAGSEFPADALNVSWRVDADRAVLEIQIRTPDKFLPPSAAENLTGAPAPGPPPNLKAAMFGPGPNWLYGAYGRWLIASGAQSVASWDVRRKSFVP